MTQSGIQHLLSDPMRQLIKQAEELPPYSPVAVETMTDEKLLHESGGAALVTDSSGTREVIFLDPCRADEYTLAHEIMHLILHRSKWPQMYSMIPDGFDQIGRRLADEIDSTLDHLVFDPRLKESGFDVDGYREQFVSVIEAWPDTKVTGPRSLFNALKILEGLLYGGKYRIRLLRAMSVRQLEALNLARQLEHHASPAKARSKQGVRRAMIAVIGFLEDWITHRSGRVQNLPCRVGISPIFTKADLRKPASQVIEMRSHAFVLDSKQFWIGALVFKADGIRFRSYVLVDGTSEPPVLAAIRERRKTLTLKEFIEAENIAGYAMLP